MSLAGRLRLMYLIYGKTIRNKRLNVSSARKYTTKTPFGINAQDGLKDVLKKIKKYTHYFSVAILEDKIIVGSDNIFLNKNGEHISIAFSFNEEYQLTEIQYRSQW